MGLLLHVVLRLLAGMESDGWYPDSDLHLD
jgi:hypothetical protein